MARKSDQRTHIRIMLEAMKQLGVTTDKQITDAMQTAKKLNLPDLIAMRREVDSIYRKAKNRAAA